MKLASLKGGREGRLVVVARDLSVAVSASSITPTMRDAIDNWKDVEAPLMRLSDQLNAGAASGAFEFDPANAMAPLPRSHQFMDASAFANHGAIMTRAHNLSIKVEPGVPLLVPRQGDDFRGPTDDFEFPSEADQCDFEGEFAVITDDIPMGASPAQARAGIKLVTMLNDISARAYVFKEIGIGFGVIRGKPATIFAPVAVTPDELGPAWQDTRIHLDMHVSRNGEWFGHPNGADMAFGFDEILSYMAYNRRLRAGTVLGSGTLSDSNYQEVGSACLAERRALDLLAGRALTPWIGFGERMRIDAKDALGASMFGAIDFKFVASSPAA